MAIARVNQFLKALESTPNISELCVKELEYLRKCCTLASLKTNLSEYRTALKNCYPEDSEILANALKILKLSQEEYSTLKTNHKTQIFIDNTNLRPIEDYDKIILKAEELIESRAYTAKAVALCLLTGRRISEILQTAKFEFVDNSNVLFSGQLKTKGSDNAQSEAYLIPVLSNSTSIIEALNQLRELKDFSGLTSKELHSKTNKSCNEAVKRYFEPLVKNCCVKDLRAIYATISYELFCPERISETAYHASILGHSELDLTTAQSYKDFYIV